MLGVNESRWTGTGKTETSTGETVSYSSQEDAQDEGVAIILKKMPRSKC